MFSRSLVEKLGIPRIIISLFFILLCLLALLYDLSLPTLLSNSVVRMGMNAIMVLAMVPGIQCGISLNLGLPIGLVAGLIGGLMTIEYGIPGWGGFLFAIAVGAAIAAVAGWLYALLLNRLKGRGDVGHDVCGLLHRVGDVHCLAGAALYVAQAALAAGHGPSQHHRPGQQHFKHILDDLLSFSIGDFTVPTGLILFMLLCCFLVWLFSRSRDGRGHAGGRQQPPLCRGHGHQCGPHAHRGHGAFHGAWRVGILVYSQSYGFMQLYTAPRQMGFIAASAILIGGASTSRCKISHVIIGTFPVPGACLRWACRWPICWCPAPPCPRRCASLFPTVSSCMR